MSNPNSNTSATDLLRSVVEFYGQVASYRDTGVVKQWILRGQPPRQISFATLFKAPTLFRFEFASPHPNPDLRHVVTRHVLGFDGVRAWSVTRRHEEAAEIETVESLSMAVAAATGVSGGAAHTIGKLLLPEHPGTSLVDLVNATMKGESEVEGIACFHVAASYPKPADLLLPEREIWIETQSLHLRKITHGTVDLPSEELRGGIVLDEPLPDQLFACPTR